MKILFITTFFIVSLPQANSQISFDSWEEESKINKRLLPRCGHLPKTADEIKSDSDYVQKTMALPQFKTRREASDHVIGLGFQYYYRQDFKTAMYRFNQAYLLDTTNTDIFWGFGAIYMAFGQYDLAKTQYMTGLSYDSANTRLLTDMGTYFMGQFYTIAQMPKSDFIKDPKTEAKRFIDSAVHYLTKSYSLDPANVNTSYKLSICYWNISDCDNAWKYYDRAKELGGRPITEAYTTDLKKRCKR